MTTALFASSLPLGTRPRSFDRLVPALLSFVAGYVDICSYLGLFRLFTAQVTGSFVVAGAQLVTSDEGVIIKILAIPVFFLSAMLTTLMVTVIRRLGHSALPWALLLDCVLIAGFLIVGVAGSPLREPTAPATVVAAFCGLCAMGSQSALVRVLFRGVGPTNYMTGNTTQIAIELADLILASFDFRRDPGNAAARERALSARSSIGGLLSLLLGFLTGAALGALIFARLGFWSALVAVLLTLAVALWSCAVVLRRSH